MKTVYAPEIPTLIDPNVVPIVPRGWQPGGAVEHMSVERFESFSGRPYTDHVKVEPASDRTLKSASDALLKQRQADPDHIISQVCPDMYDMSEKNTIRSDSWAFAYFGPDLRFGIVAIKPISFGAFLGVYSGCAESNTGILLHEDHTVELSQEIKVNASSGGNMLSFLQEAPQPEGPAYAPSNQNIVDFSGEAICSNKAATANVLFSQRPIGGRMQLCAFAFANIEPGQALMTTYGIQEWRRLGRYPALLDKQGIRISPAEYARTKKWLNPRININVQRLETALNAQFLGRYLELIKQGQGDGALDYFARKMPKNIAKHGARLLLEAILKKRYHLFVLFLSIGAQLPYKDDQYMERLTQIEEGARRWCNDAVLALSHRFQADHNITELGRLSRIFAVKGHLLGLQLLHAIGTPMNEQAKTSKKTPLVLAEEKDQSDLLPFLRKHEKCNATCASILPGLS